MWPSMLLTAWIAQRLKNTLSSAFVHVGGNAILSWLFYVGGRIGIRVLKHFPSVILS